jgi:hypothetical protein
MPFIAACPFCRRKVQAPTSAMGRSITCKKCHNNYTLAPSEDIQQPTATKGGAAAAVGALRTPVAMPAPARTDPAQVDTAAHAVVVTTPDTPRLQIPPAPTMMPAPMPVAPATRRVPWNGFAVASFFLGGLALVSASLPWLQWLTFPLAGAGLLAGLICLLATPLETLRDVVLLLVGEAVSVAVILIALVWPALFGMDPRLTRDTPAAPDANRQLLQPHVAASGGGSIKPQTLEANQWAAADKYDIDHGNVRLSIAAAAIRDEPPGDRKDKRREKELSITVKLSHVGVKDAVAFYGWQTPHAPRLTVAGHAVAFKRRHGEGPAGSRNLVPFQPIQELLIFEAPPATDEVLRLELPAAAFGGAGVVRFELPRTMLSIR